MSFPYFGNFIEFSRAFKLPKKYLKFYKIPENKKK